MLMDPNLSDYELMDILAGVFNDAVIIDDEGLERMMSELMAEEAAKEVTS